MKRKDDPRHKKRQELVGLLFSTSFRRNHNIRGTGTYREDFRKIISDIKQIDTMIAKAAPEFPVEKINKIDLAILRLAVYELLIEKANPEKVIIDEAIELGKEFAGDTSPSFINGVLGKILMLYGKRSTSKNN